MRELDKRVAALLLVSTTLLFSLPANAADGDLSLTHSSALQGVSKYP